MSKFNEPVQQVVEEYPELEDVSDDALEAFALASNIHLAEQFTDEMKSAKEELKAFGVDLDELD